MRYKKINKNMMKKQIGTTLAIFLLIYLVAQIAPDFTNKYKKDALFNQEFVLGTVTKVIENNTEEDPFVSNRFRGNQKFTVLIEEGSQKGQIFTINHTLSSVRSAYAYEGLKAIFTVRTDSKGNIVVWLYNYRREYGVYFLIFLLVFIVLLIGKKEGLNSLLALIFTATVLFYVVVPGMWTPHPVLIAIISSIIICLVSYLLIAGMSKKALIASLGTLFGITLAGLLSYIMGLVLNLSGVDMEKGEALLYLAQDRGFKLKNLLFVSILFSSLGATMDIAISIASSSEQLLIVNPQIEKRALFSSLLAVGKDIIGTMTNTLVLAFCGASLPLAMMIWGYDMSYKQFINIPIIVINILQALCGSIGMVSSVLFTAICAILLNFRRKK
ncbi:MAG: YibE/F family protein [Spirochaetia bacterium]|nr:YibE/F family protein [Spirochaetia bacterium]